jgi:ATP-binding cassette subfamily G (WHITE) protein 2 (SNQ2)
MCLILGTPGSGCTTFLKAIANEREGFYHVGGDVHYAGIDAREMAKTYKGELVYNAEGALWPRCIMHHGMDGSTNAVNDR